MNATDQSTAADAMERTGWHWYRPVSMDRANIARLELVPWATMLVRITRGETRGYVLARDVEQSDPAQLTLVPGGRE